MSIYFIPIFVLLVFLFALFKKQNTYKSFTDGAKDAVQHMINLIPIMATIFISVELFRHSGLLDYFVHLFAPVFGLFGIPAEVVSLVILRPFSGSGSTAVLNQIFNTHGVNSYIARVASVIASTSDTVFFISAVYFSKTNIKKLGFAIPIALITTMLSATVAAAVCLII